MAGGSSTADAHGCAGKALSIFSDWITKVSARSVHLGIACAQGPTGAAQTRSAAQAAKSRALGPRALMCV